MKITKEINNHLLRVSPRRVPIFLNLSELLHLRSLLSRDEHNGNLEKSHTHYQLRHKTINTILQNTINREMRRNQPQEKTRKDPDVL